MTNTTISTDFKVTSIDEIYHVHKEVSYKGLTLVVPEFIKYIATDSSGEIWGFNYEPAYTSDDDWWSSCADNASGHFRTIKLCKSAYEGDWKNSLVKL